MPNKRSRSKFAAVQIILRCKVCRTMMGVFEAPTIGEALGIGASHESELFSRAPTCRKCFRVWPAAPKDKEPALAPEPDKKAPVIDAEWPEEGKAGELDLTPSPGAE